MAMECLGGVVRANPVVYLDLRGVRIRRDLVNSHKLYPGRSPNNLFFASYRASGMFSREVCRKGWGVGGRLGGKEERDGGGGLVCGLRDARPAEENVDARA